MEELERGSAAAADRSAAVFQNAFDAFVVADDDGRYVDANPAACALFGLERERLLGRRIEEFAAPEYDYESAWAAFETDAVTRGEFPLRRPDGSVRIVQYAATRDVRPGEHLSVLRDVTEHVEREEALAAQLERLDQFAGMVSHDLRNPLAVAMGRFELYRETGETAHYDAAVGALETIDRITGELLRLARAAGDEADRELLALADVAREVWAEVGAPDDALSVADAPALRAVPGQLHLLLVNLFRNALEHGGEDVRVRVGGLTDGFFVEDTGPGVPEAERADVVEPGYTTGEGGTGVGLTIVQQVASAQGWAMSVGEGPEGGARFSFRAECPPEL